MPFPTEINLNLKTLWSPPLVPTGAVLKLGGSMSRDKTQLSSDWDCSTRPNVLRRCPQGCFFHPIPTSTSQNLWSPPSVPTGVVLKLGGSIPIDRLMLLVKLRFCQCWSSTLMFLLVSILSETYLLVTNPFLTGWSPLAVLIGVVLKLGGSISVVVGSC